MLVLFSLAACVDGGEGPTGLSDEPRSRGYMESCIDSKGSIRDDLCDLPYVCSARICKEPCTDVSDCSTWEGFQVDCTATLQEVQDGLCEILCNDAPSQCPETEGAPLKCFPISSDEGYCGGDPMKL